MNREVLDLTCLDAENTRRLNQIALKNKRKYTEFVDKYSKKYGHFYLWWALPFSSRNTFLDGTFLNICYLHLCQQLIFGDDEIKRIKVNDKALYDTLLLNYGQELLRKNIVLENSGKGTSLFKIIKGMFWQLKAQIKHFLRVRIYLRGHKYDIRDDVTLIDTPLLSSCFHNGKYEDRYFDKIQNYTEKNIYFIPSLMKNSSVSWKEFVKDVEKSREYRFIFKEALITIFDYLYLIEYYAYCLALSVRKYGYGDIDVTPLIRDSILKGSCCVPSLEGVLNDRFIKRLKKTSFRINNLISWYEGRPSEIMLQRAFRKYYPDRTCIGYIGFPHFEFSLGEYISEEQYVQNIAPLKMTVPGMVYEEQAKQFCDKVDLIRVPILRNNYKSEIAQMPAKRKILVILPFFEEAANKMLHIVNEYMRLKSHDVDIVVKNHPVHKGRTIDYYLKEQLYFVPQYVEEDLIKALKGISLAYISRSTASLEVLSQGVFLVNLCPAGELRSTAIPDNMDKEDYRIVYDEKETFEAFEFGLWQRKGNRNQLNLTDLLEPINERTVGRMWD